MRKLSGAGVAMILAIAFYFTIVWGFDGLHALTSPGYGLDNAWRSQFVFGLGSLFGLGPIGLLKLAAFFATGVIGGRHATTDRLLQDELP